MSKSCKKFKSVSKSVLHNSYVITVSKKCPSCALFKLGPNLTHAQDTSCGWGFDYFRWCYLGVTINTGPGTRGPGTQRSSSVALSFYDRNATCVNVLSSNVRLYRCWSQSPHCYTHC